MIIRAKDLAVGDVLTDGRVVAAVVVSEGKRTMSRVRIRGARARYSGWPIPTKVVVATISGQVAKAYFWPREKVEIMVREARAA